MREKGEREERKAEHFLQGSWGRCLGIGKDVGKVLAYFTSQAIKSYTAQDKWLPYKTSFHPCSPNSKVKKNTVYLRPKC